MDAIEAALKSGDLESRVGNFMGNAYRKLLLHQVERLVDKLGVGVEGGGGEAGDEETAKSDKEMAKSSSSSSNSSNSSSNSSGERRKRLADIEVQLEEIEEKKRKLIKEKKRLEKESE